MNSNYNLVDLLLELQEDLQDAAADLGGAVARDPEENLESTELAMKLYQEASTKMTNAIEMMRKARS